jgi:glycosyltransferase involved in cell wall biosynthesis
MERGVPAGKLIFIPNGANIRIFQPQPERREQRRAELGLDGKFVVLYAGIFGLAQGMESLVEAAHQLSNHPDIHFLFIGEGPKKAEIAALKESLGLNNLMLLGERPQIEMASYFSTADVALVPLRRLELRGAFPSKMFEAWACECPVVLSVSGEAQAVLAQARAGICAEPENSASIVAAILALKNAPEARREFGRNGRRFVVENYSREKAAQQLEQLLSGLAKSEHPAHV